LLCFLAAAEEAEEVDTEEAEEVDFLVCQVLQEVLPAIKDTVAITVVGEEEVVVATHPTTTRKRVSN